MYGLQLNIHIDPEDLKELTEVLKLGMVNRHSEIGQSFVECFQSVLVAAENQHEVYTSEKADGLQIPPKNLMN